jgi:acyl-CoA synthetase (AMP-forming)/AMP-acid ligase II
MWCLVDNLERVSFAELLQDTADQQPHETGYIFLVDGESQTVSITYQDLDQ